MSEIALDCGYPLSSLKERIYAITGNGTSAADREWIDCDVVLMSVGFAPSLNLGAAVQVISYELRMAALADVVPASRAPESPPATHEELERFYRHLESALAASEFLDKRSPEQLMRRVRRLYGRTGLDRNEVQILRGMLTALAPDAAHEPPRSDDAPGNT